MLLEEIESKRLLVSINTIQEEVDYIWNFMGRMQKFKTFGYNLSLPNTYEMNLIVNKALEHTLVKDDKKVIFSEVTKVYDLEFYQEAFIKVKDSLNTVKKIFQTFEYYNKEWKFKIFEEYTIKITLFGPGGSYYHENGEILMKKSNCITRPAETIVHELVHIGIEENIIEKFDIPHPFKERIVDKFIQYHFGEIFPQYRIQRVGDDLIDKYLSYEDSWSRLPYYMNQFKTEHLKS